MSTIVIPPPTKIKLTDIIVRPGRGRKTFPNLGSLAQSIKDLANKPGATSGLINPVVVSPSTEVEGKFELVAGERRYRAHMMLAVEDPRFNEIDTIDRQYADEKTRKEVELIENLERVQLEWLEECELVRQIDQLKKDEHGRGKSTAFKKEEGVKEGWTTAKTAELLGQGVKSVTAKILVAKKMLERPDIKERVKHLPLSQALKEFERIEGVERVKKQVETGGLKISSDILEGDAVELLKTLKNETVDLVVTDPPFGIEELSNSEGKVVGQNRSYTGLMKTGDNSTFIEVGNLMTRVIPELFRVLKPGGQVYLFFGFDLFDLILKEAKKAGFETDSVPLIWYKGRQTSGFMGYDYAPCYEPLFHFHKPPRKRLNAEGKKLLEFPPPTKEEKLTAGGNHPFQKPQALISYLIEQSSKKTDLVLDPFSGSGTTGVSALELGRAFLGMEQDHERYISSQERLSRTKSKLEAKG